MVESQEQVATTRLVDSLEKQRVLEDMLEATKPPPRPSDRRLHYLLSTPFRYPPLRHGSRFGTRQQLGIFYGSATLETLLAEVAYYRLVFWYGMGTPPAERLSTQHTAFTARYKTANGVRLQSAPFDKQRAALGHPEDYRATQQLGTAMRAAGVEAFEYVSARDGQAGINIGLFTPRALLRTSPEKLQAWIAETDSGAVRFLGSDQRRLFAFSLKQFAVRGRLPRPAA